MNLLIDLAHKNRKQSCDSYSTGSSVQSSSASPRRLRRNKVSASDNNTDSSSKTEKTAMNSMCTCIIVWHFMNYINGLLLFAGFNNQNQSYTVTMQTSVGSDSETSTMSLGSYVGQPVNAIEPTDKRVMNDTFTVDSNQLEQQRQKRASKSNGDESEYYNEEELWRLMDVDEFDGTNQSDRPSHLDINSTSGCTPVATRKPMFQFSGNLIGQPLANQLLPAT